MKSKLKKEKKKEREREQNNLMTETADCLVQYSVMTDPLILAASNKEHYSKVWSHD